MADTPLTPAEVLDALCAEPGTYRVMTERYGPDIDPRAAHSCVSWIQIAGSDAARFDMERRLGSLIVKTDALMASLQMLPRDHVKLELSCSNAQELRTLLDQRLGPLHRLVA